MENEILQKHKQGIGQETIAKELGLNRNQVRKVLHDYGLTNTRRIVADEEIVKVYHRTKSIRATRDELNIGYDAVKSALQRENISQYKTYTGSGIRGVYSKNRILDGSGYIKWYDPTDIHAGPFGWVYEHRYVLGNHIGRRLEGHETPHHKNGNRSDNRIENLELWSKAQPAGQRVVDKMKWVYEMLDLYGKEYPRSAIIDSEDQVA